jgi:pimeloyl-ACP methyl ester carboxylesterase
MTTAAIAAQTGQYVCANGLTIYYEVHGDGPPLILLHGGTLTCRSWDGHIATLAAYFQVVALDSRGHGKTDNPTGTFSFRAMADDVAAFIKELHLDTPLIVGFSDGGQIALDLGIRYPALARALVIVGAYGRLTESALRWIHAFGIEGPHNVNVERMERERPSLVRIWQAQHTAQGPDTWKTLIDQISEMWYAPLGYTEADVRGVIAPVLIALGDRDGAIPVEEATYLYRLMPNAELAITPNAEHFFPDTTHPLFAQILDFLLRHQAKPATEKL